MASAKARDPIAEGMAHHQAGRLAEAEACYRRVLTDDPGHASANHLLGMVAKARHQHDEAVRLIEQALARQPHFPEAHYNLGNTQSERGDLDAAIACYERAVAQKPAFEDAWVNKGRSLQQRGDHEEAIEAFRAVLRINPESGKAWENLTLVHTFAGEDAEVEAMRSALDRVDPKGGTAKSLHYALANARTQQGHLDAAMAHYATGNALARSASAYTSGAEERFMQTVTQAFPRERVAALQGYGDTGARPIFILGMPRSGTTLIEQILVSHPRVAAGGERQDVNQILEKVSVPNQPDARYPQWVAALDGDDLTRLGRAYLQRLPSPVEAGTDRLTDKLPGNFRVLGLIHLMLPNAAIVHVHREPAATCVSCYLHNFTNGHLYATDLGDLGRYYRAYHGLMAHWRSVLPNGAFLDVRYEDVVADPEGQIARLLEHCGLEWDDRCVRFHETDRPVQTASMDQVRQPLYHKALARWRRWTPYLGPLFTALGDLAPSNEEE